MSISINHFYELDNMVLLTHFMQLVSFYTSWKHRNTIGFLMLSQGTERENSGMNSVKRNHSTFNNLTETRNSYFCVTRKNQSTSRVCITSFAMTQKILSKNIFHWLEPVHWNSKLSTNILCEKKNHLDFLIFPNFCKKINKKTIFLAYSGSLKTMAETSCGYLHCTITFWL